MTGHQPPGKIVSDTVEETNTRAAAWLAKAIRRAVAAHGTCTMAVSGGHSPWPMFEILARDDTLPWGSVTLFQVDERIAPAGDDARNLTHLEANLIAARPDLRVRLHPMPVNDPDLAAACDRYAAAIHEATAGTGALDVVHLGLGPDGHTASLVPHDGVLACRDRDVALTSGPYQGHRRMTLTYDCLNRARGILWQVVGADKAGALAAMMRGSAEVPGGLIATARATVFADRAASP